MHHKLLLLDLDGTVRETASGKTFISEPKDQKLIIGATDAIANYHARGWKIVGISNQGGVAEGFKSLKKCVAEQRYTMQLARHIDRVYFCPSKSDTMGDTCWIVRNISTWLPSWVPGVKWVAYDGFGENPAHALGGYRKPNPGMIRLAIADCVNRAIAELLDGTAILSVKAQLAIAQDELENTDLIEVLYVGDREEDRKASEAAGVDFMWAHEWRGDR